MRLIKHLETWIKPAKLSDNIIITWVLNLNTITWHAPIQLHTNYEMGHSGLLEKVKRKHD